MHWAWRVTIAVLVACVYGGLSVTVLMDAHEWVADGVGDLLSLTHPVRTGVGVPIAWFAPITLLAFAVFGLLTRWFGRPGFSDDETRCRRCGYILRGITEPRCSECGERI